jgi:hypothetical protein
MSKLKTIVVHASWLSTAVAAALLTAAPGCGKTTRIGDVVPAPDGGASGQGGSAAGATSDGAAGTGTPSGGNSGAGSGGASGSGASGDAGIGGSAAGSAGSTTEDAGPAPCQLAKPPPSANPSAGEQERAGLISAFCNAISQQGCLDAFSLWGWSSSRAKTCSSGERITACEQDTLYSYLRSITPECDDEWRNAIRCATTADYAADQCALPLDPAQTGTTPAPARCTPERNALNMCQQEHSGWETITGARASCGFGRGNFDPSTCTVLCTVGENNFHTDCSAPPGLPLFCACSVNGETINDPLDLTPYSVGSCREMAQLMADGACVDRLDCCFTWVYQGAEACSCASMSSLGMPSCEAAAQAAKGKVVDICPQYKPDPGSCWPPWDCGPQPP